MIIETLQRRRKLSTRRKCVYALKNLKAELFDFFFFLPKIVSLVNIINLKNQ